MRDDPQTIRPRPVPAGAMAICVGCLATLALLPFLQLGDGRNIPRTAIFLGRFHTMILHVPIGLILLAVAMENAHLAALRRWIPRVPDGTSRFLIFFAALSAFCSTVLGWMLSFSGGYEPELLNGHFYAGLATAVGANLALGTKLIADSRPLRRSVRWLYQALLIATTGALGWAGHLGASITHGEDYLTEFAPNPVRRMLGVPIWIDPADQPPKPIDEQLAFGDIVQPILNQRCVTCHSGQKAKGGLRLDRFEDILKGGDGGAAVIAGDPGLSDLIRRARLPVEESAHMPPKGKPQLSEDEMAILAWWIETGAPNDTPAGKLELPEESRLAIQRQIPAALREKIEATMRERAGRIERSLASLRREIPGSIRAIVPGEAAFEFSAGSEAETFGDEDLRKLSQLGESLEWLDLERTKVTDSGLEALAQMPHLTRLELQETATGDAGLRSVSQLKELEVLNLYGTRVDDAGIEHLKPLTKLRKLYVWRTGITEAGERQLQEAVPKLEIIRPQGSSSPETRTADSPR